MASPDHANQLDQELTVENTIRLFENGLTTSVTPQGGRAIVDGWADKIESTGRDDLRGIASLLRTLSNQLGITPLDGKVIGNTMQRLGAHTAETAASADDDLAEPLKKLGGLVKAAGIALTGGARPDEIAGISTDASGTTGDPQRRSNTLAPDLSKTRTETDDAGVRKTNADVREDVHVTGSDLTKGDEPLHPH